MIMKRLSFGAAAICLVAACVSACSSESTGGTDPQTTTKEQQQLGTVQASAATKALGIAVWRTVATSNTIMGLDDSGSIITAITVDVEAGRIRTTAPDVGTRSIKNPSDSTLSPKATAFADAAKADLKAAVENSDNVPVGGASGVEKAYWTYACYQIYQDCSSKCLYQLYYGYWHACECDYPAAECPTSPYIWALRYN